MSLAEKRETAEELRAELSALRVEKEHLLHAGNSDVHEQRMDDEITRLQREVELARSERDAAANGGSVDDATEAMRAAAAMQADNGSVDLATPLEVHQPESNTSPDVAPVDEQPAEVTLLDAPLPLAGPTTDAPKADGE